MNSKAPDVIDQERLTSSPAPTAPVARESKRGTHLLVLLLLSGLVFLLGTLVSNQLDIPTGDEPHYLVISQTILIYHSLDVTLDYSHNDYKTFYAGPLGPFQHTSRNKWGQVLPLHSIGAPILWLIPFALAGRLGTLLFMSLLSVLIILSTYELLVSLGIERFYAFIACLGLTLASPIWIYSHHDFVEPIAALLCVYIAQVLFKKQLRALDLVGSSLALGILPWIHIRFALFEVILACFLLLRVYQEYRWSKISAYLYAILPVCGMFLLFEGYNLFVWGSLNPAINQASSGELPFDVAPWRGLFGLFFDQEYGLLTNFPIFLFLLGGLILACKRRLLRFNLLVVLMAVPYIFIVASFHNWDGAISPPARFLLVLVPLLTFYVALALQLARNWLVNGLFFLFMGISIAYEIASISVPGGWMNWEEGHSRPLLLISQKLHLALTRDVPSVWTHTNQVAPTTGWLIFLAVLTLAVVLLAKRRSAFAGHSQIS